ncbi:MAG: penicillin acylase family protein [Gammaproteobacteria bacterium]|jgi:acyl-homoserine-lactone acylase|nr:penicillin acylase family protein [Gammaproteobacteria bacterium]HJN95508.1 penicillin acylase family protein [Gammaproteobacteria bacterium]|tara:strand:+ start:11763 stop:14012 length:2250 start_codon:yes stop_codon:yes gene_type:complete
MNKSFWALIGSISLLVACNPEPEVQSAANAVELRWTNYGIPHIKADSWHGLGYGFAYAVATDTVCVLAREMVTVRGEQAKYFGASEGNIHTDTFHRALLNPAKIDEYLDYGSESNKLMDAGYVEGYNRYIESHRGQLPASCNNEPWVKPIDTRDLARLTIGVGIRYGLGRVTSEIATAQPGLSLASLNSLDLFVDTATIGSNAVAFGSELTESGRGILLGNPHYPWHGPSRFHMAHLTLPGEIDVMGVGLITTPRIAIGFTPQVAWTHTVSTALRFTMFRLELVEGNPMAYRLGDAVKNIEAIEVEVETDAGTVPRTVYMSHLGPVVVSEATPWSDRHVYVMRDVNYENYRSGDQYKDIQKAQNVSELREALADHQGAAFVNTIAADRFGGALYADMSAIPNVSAELIERCDTGLDSLGGGRVITLNGSDPDCDWQVDPTAAAPGLMPPSQQPSLITQNYVTNSNDSYWLSNPETRLEGYSPIIGNEQTTRSLRTRAGLNFVEQVLDSGETITQATLQNLLFNHRHYGAELFVDDIIAVCQVRQAQELTEACAILSEWDRRQDVDSVGAHIFNEFWAAARSIREHFAVPFDVNDPVHTPRGLTVTRQETQDYIVASLGAAVSRLQKANIPLDASWGDVQFAMRNGEKIGIPGGNGGAGMFSVIGARLNDENQGYNPIFSGNSYIQAITWSEDGTPEARAILTYSQSPEPNSAHYADMTRLYSRSEWVTLPFTDEQIASELVRSETLQIN